MAGTPLYMAPEVLRRAPPSVRSDIYSLGVLLYHLATGGYPIAARTFGEVRRAHQRGDWRRLRDERPDLPMLFVQVVERAIDRDPQQRFESAGAMEAALAGALTPEYQDRTPAKLPDREVEAERVTPAMRTLQEHGVFERHRSAWLMTGALIVFVTAMLVLAWWRDGMQPPPIGQPRQVTTAPGWEAEPALSPDGGLLAYASDESGNPDIWIIDVQGGNALRLTDHPGSDRNPVWFPDGSHIAFVSDRGGALGIWKVPRLGGAASLIIAGAQDPEISPDGSRIAVSQAAAGAGTLRIAVASLNDTGRLRHLTGDGDGLWDHHNPAWSPNGEMISYQAQRDLWLIPAAGGKARQLTRDGEVDYEPAWSHDGRYVYFSSARDGTTAVWRVSADGGAPSRMTMGSGPENHPSVSRNGARLAYSTFVENTDVILRDLETGREERLQGIRDDLRPALAPDRSAIVFVSDRWGGRYDLWIQPLVGERFSGTPRRLTDHPGSASHPTFSPDGRWVAYQRLLEGQRDIWVVPTAGGASIQIASDPANEYHPDWAPDGGHLAFMSERSGGGHVWLVPVAQGRPSGPARQLTHGPMEYESPAWSPDGREIAVIGVARTAHGDVWVLTVDGSAPPRRVTFGAQVQSVRWDAPSASLLVSGLWGGDSLTLRRVSKEGGPAKPLDPSVVLSRNPAYGDFDVSLDGRLVVFSRPETRGDIWIVEARARSY
jgi:Tol biopolymer transport system component